MTESSDPSSGARTGLRWVLRVVGAGLFLHFLFLAPLTAHVSILAVVLFLLAILLIVPFTRRRLSRLPFLGLLDRGALRGALVLILLAGANHLLMTRDVAEIVRDDYAFVGATLVTGHRGADPISDGVVLVSREGRITAVGTAKTVPVPADSTVVDISGKYLLPGLINAHGHLMLTGRPPGGSIEMERFALEPWMMDLAGAFLRTYAGNEVVLFAMKRNARRALEGGVTTLRGLGDPHYVDVRLRRQIESGDFLGPRLLVAGPVLCVTGGHAHQIGQIFDGPHEARRAVRTSLAQQVDLIKIANTGGVSDSRRIGEAGELQMTPEEIEAVVDEAHRKNVLVAAHAESAQGVLEALRAGVDSIEHGAELDEEALRLFLHNPRSLRGYTTLHPTLSVIGGDLELNERTRNDPVVRVMYENGRDIKRRMLTGFAQALAAGVKIGVGTDAGIVAHESVWKEMEYFVEIGGISNEEAIHWGTLATAESIGVDEITGSIDAGKFADFVVLDGNPIADLTAFEEPALVVVAGTIVYPR